MNDFKNMTNTTGSGGKGQAGGGTQTGGQSSGTSGSATTAVPEAKEAMDRFKTEVANELGVPLKQGYNGDLTSAQAGSIGGEMVKQMIMRQEQQMSAGQ